MAVTPTGTDHFDLSIATLMLFLGGCAVALITGWFAMRKNRADADKSVVETMVLEMKYLKEELAETRAELAATRDELTKVSAKLNTVISENGALRAENNYLRQFAPGNGVLVNEPVPGVD